MPSLYEKDRANLQAILESIEKIEKFVVGLKDADEFYEDERTFDAALMNFVVIGETVSKLSEELRNLHPGVPWTKVKGFRNIIRKSRHWTLICSYIPTSDFPLPTSNGGTSKVQLITSIPLHLRRNPSRRLPFKCRRCRRQHRLRRRLHFLPGRPDGRELQDALDRPHRGGR